jgi:hypothetical protein
MAASGDTHTDRQPSNPDLHLHSVTAEDVAVILGRRDEKGRG